MIKIATQSNYWNYLHTLCGPESCTLLDVAPRDSWLKYLKIWQNSPIYTIRSVLRQFQYKMRSFKTNCYLPEWATFEKISEIGAQQMRYMKMNSLGFIQLLGKVIPAN